MTFQKIKLVVLMFILIITGCIKPPKDETTLPGKIILKISIADHGGYIFPWFRGYIGVKSVRFEGKRDAGEDVFFETNPDQNFPVLDISKGGYISNFDIPRGVYNDMKMDIELKKIVVDPILDYELDSLNIGLLFIGHYEIYYGDPESPLPIYYIVDDTVTLSFRSEPNRKFVLSDKESGVSLILDPFFAIGTIDQDIIENLEPSGNIVHQVILISSSKNKDMHEYILSQIYRSAKIIF
jgi:hypothetical protein